MRQPRFARTDSPDPLQRNAVVGAIVALHAVLAWGLLQIAPVRDAVADVAPLFVSLVVPTMPERPPEPPPPPPEPPRAAPKAPLPPPAIAAAHAPAPFVVAEPQPLPAPVDALVQAPYEPVPPSPPATPAPPAPPAPPPPPKDLPASAIQYLEPPAPTYPRASRRLGEAGLVVVRVFVDAQGLPRQVQVQQSSGHARLDDAAVDAVRQARFRPYVENGQPTAGWARIPIPFELEK